jgi:hypothetical protein
MLFINEQVDWTLGTRSSLAVIAEACREHLQLPLPADQ